MYGLLVLLKIPVRRMSYDTHGIFYNLVNFAFNLPNYVIHTYTYIHTYTLLMLPKWAFQLNRIKKYKFI